MLRRNIREHETSFITNNDWDFTMNMQTRSNDTHRKYSSSYSLINTCYQSVQDPGATTCYIFM